MSNRGTWYFFVKFLNFVKIIIFSDGLKIEMKEIIQHLAQIKKFCHSNKVKALFAFGSVTTENFSSESDIDLIVDIVEKYPLLYSNNYFNLKTQLERLFHRHIDLLKQRIIKNPYLK